MVLRVGGGAGSMGSWGSRGVRTEEMNIGGIPPCGHTLATHRGLSLAWGVYPLLCRDTEDYRIPPAVSRHTGGYNPHARGIPPPVSRHRGLYPLCCMPPCVATHGGYTPPTTQGS
jgi:hypothetical protein